MQYYRSLSDDDLTILLKSGSESAFEALYHRYWKELLFVAAHKAPSMEDAEEIVHDIFESLWSRRQSLVIKSTLKMYLATAVKYKIIKLIDK